MLPGKETAMGNNARKKERHRLKRRKKHQALRRRISVSQYQRIGSSGELERSLINDNWRESGQAVIFVLRRVGGGGHAMAGFMVDLWCAGLKDAWGRIDIRSEEFDAAIDRTPEELELVEADPETVRGVVAGSIRFAVQNGFRLPGHYERWLAMLGGVGDWKTADLSDFGVDGKLRWVGPIEDLEQRLIGCSVEEFLARDDVDFFMGCDEPPETDEETDVIEESGDLVQEQALSAIRRWCFTAGEIPHPRLDEALAIVMASVLQAPDDGEDIEQPDLSAAGDNISRFLSLEKPDDAGELTAALAQFQRFASSSETAEEFLETIGIGGQQDAETP